MDKILLFIPMYNCEKQIVRVLDQLTDEVCDYISEVIIVNNRSTDNGEAAVNAYLKDNNLATKIKILRNDENYGLGGSHKVAFNYAISHDFDYVIVLHGDDQGRIKDFLPIIKSGKYRDYDCVLGSRFSRGSSLIGYSTFRIFGNKVFNILFSIGAKKRIYDLGAGLNMYKVQTLKSNYYHKFMDNLTFNCYMLLYEVYAKQNIVFIPISWREDDQVSNVKMASQAKTTLGLLGQYIFRKNEFINGEHRTKIIESYSAKEINDEES